MAEQSISQTYKNILSDLEGKKLLSALDSLKKLAGAATDWELLSELETLSNSYASLLSCMGKGITDKGRDAFYVQFLREAYMLAIRCYRAIKTKERHTIYYTTLNEIGNNKTTIASLIEKFSRLDQHSHLSAANGQNTSEKLCKEEKEKLLEQIFNQLWTSGFLNADEITLLLKAFQNNQSTFSDNNLLIFISALTLSLLHFLDPGKLQLLIELYAAGNSRIKSRALVGIVFGILMNKGYLHLFPETQEALRKLSSQPFIGRQLSILQIQLLSFSTTKDVVKDIEDMLKPVFAKGNAATKQGFNISLINGMLDNDKEFASAEEKELNEHLQKSAEKLMKMYQQGIDVYFTTFRNMKRFTFFNTVANWFIPFDPDNSFLSKSRQAQMRPMLSLLSESGLCDSDKYSAMLMLQSIPIPGNSFPANEISSLFGTSDIKREKEPQHEEALRNSYLQDCYRFFMLYYRSNELHNPFKEDLVILRIPYICNIISKDSGNIAFIASAAFQTNNFSLTAEAFNLMPSAEVLSPESLQIYGSSLLKIGQAERAIGIFRLADTLKPNSLAIMHNLATSYRTTGNREAALNIYAKMMRIAPENMKILFRYGESLFLNGQKAEALKIFYKLEFLEPSSLSAKRAIAWCSLSSKLPEKAEQYYGKILAMTPKAEDYLNSGHTAWCNGNLPLAVKRYKKYIQKTCEGDARLFYLPASDIELLKHYNISENDIQLMKDLLVSS